MAADLAREPTNELTAAMSRLSQADAAWVLGVDPRILRDHPLPRDKDGKYDAHRLVAWQARRLPRPDEIDDVELERFMVVAEAIGVTNDGCLPALVAFFADVQTKFGDAGHLLLIDLVIAELRRQLEVETELDSPQARRQRELAERKAREAEEARDSLRVAYRCRCGNVRRGPKWLKGKAPLGHEELESVCPSCEKRGRA